MAGIPKSTRNRVAIKSAKPRDDFPLFVHPRGYWAKKVRGKTAYFGRVVDDPKGQAALLLWLDRRDDLLAGRTPRSMGEGLTLREMVNRFLTTKQNLVDSGELTPRSWSDYRATCERILNAFGKSRLVDDLSAQEFEGLRAALGKMWGPVAVGNEIGRIRVVFRYAYEVGLIDRPVRYGPGFKRPSKRILTLHRQQQPKKLFTAEELRAVLDQSVVHLKAMILLGINAGLGNSDVGLIEFRHIDMDNGWLDYPRPKTAVERRAKLWPETVAALKDAIACRQQPKDALLSNRVFITKYGQSWAKATKDSPIANEMGKLLTELKIKRRGVGFYSLRHTFETIGGGSRDQVAVNYIMGHSPMASDMSAVYREAVDDERLKAVSDHMRRWLWPPKSKKAKSVARRSAK